MSVVVELLGGLGNQMFQYAAGRALAHRLDVPLKLDVSRFEDYKLRSYKLNHLSIEEKIATPDDLKFCSVPEGGWKLSAFRIKNFFLPWHSKNIIKERSWNYDEDFTLIKKDCFLQGYWQSEKYFEHIEDIIRREFQVTKDPSDVNRSLLSRINNSCSVSIHIRRGDYVTNPVTNQVHGFVGKQYYQEAIAYFESKLGDPVFFVFSDDMEWAEKNIQTNSPVVFVDHNGAHHDYDDLRLMKNCKYHIIANSSFSWWGAWLSDFKRNKVIAPKNWFTQKLIQKKGNFDIVPDRWMRL